jgi:periplasmic copper chaperone A
LRHLAFFLIAAVAPLSGCTQHKPVRGVEHAEVRLPAVKGNPGAAYFTLKGGTAEERLAEVTSPQVIRIELHDSAMKDGMMAMSKMESGVAIPAGGSVAFAPGGRHAMLFDINPAVKAGGTLKLIFAYADGSRIEADAAVKGAGDPMSEHSH